jgi:hypothetical protein
MKKRDDVTSRQLLRLFMISVAPDRIRGQRKQLELLAFVGNAEMVTAEELQAILRYSASMQVRLMSSPYKQRLVQK